MIWIFVGFFLATQLALCALFLAAAKRRMDQGRVLWAMAIAAHSGVPMPDEIDAVAPGLSKRQRRRAYMLSDRMRSGEMLEEALKRTPGVIPHAAALEVIIGMENGTLAETLRDTAARHTTRGRIPATAGPTPTLGLVYLVIFPMVVLNIVGFLMYFIVPKFKKIFDDFGVELPAITKQLINYSDTFVSYGALMFPALAVLAIVIVLICVRYVRGWGEGDVPLLGRLFRRLDVPGVLRSLAIAVKARGSLEESLMTLSIYHRRQSMRKSLAVVSNACRHGDDCWYAMRDAGLLTKHEVAVLRSAARVGNLPWALGQLADTAQRRVAHRWMTLMEFVSPVIIVGVGSIAAFIFIAFFFPLVSLLNALS